MGEEEPLGIFVRRSTLEEQPCASWWPSHCKIPPRNLNTAPCSPYLVTGLIGFSTPPWIPTCCIKDIPLTFLLGDGLKTWLEWSEIQSRQLAGLQGKVLEDFSHSFEEKALFFSQKWVIFHFFLEQKNASQSLVWCPLRDQDIMCTLCIPQNSCFPGLYRKDKAFTLSWTLDTMGIDQHLHHCKHSQD